MKRKQCVLQLADPFHKEGMKHPYRISSQSGLPLIMDSAAQMGAPQMCNNSIKPTSLCFHKVKYTHKTPTGILYCTPPYTLAIQKKICVTKVITTV